MPHLRTDRYSLQSEWVKETQRGTSHIRVRVKSSAKSERIALRVAPRARIVISIVVVEEPYLPVEVLPREPQREVEVIACAAGIIVRHVVPEGFTLIPPPYRRTRAVGDQPRRVQMICLK